MMLEDLVNAKFAQYEARIKDLLTYNYDQVQRVRDLVAENAELKREVQTLEMIYKHRSI